ncbi:UNVERIFIED_CONTAM: hypothetical protein Slati_2417600 [Sesamum latifolium]|uniref:Retroviral polymerase SH3-like domain-containing protein n=1 Tax=Sesamum latifolium TaxID=2727402 RepID=A0AAW2WHC4_9LAMI
MTKKPFVGQSAIANGLLDLVHTDVCGPLSIPARGGFSYFITFTDDSRYGLCLPDKNGILSQWTPPGTPLLNRVAERRNQTFVGHGSVHDEFYGTAPSFWGYALETAAKLLNIAPSKFIGYPKETVGYYFYDPAVQKIFISRNAVFLEKDFPSDSRHDEVLIEESNEEPHRDTTTSFEPMIHTDSVPVLRRSLENLEYLIGTDSWG